MHTGRGLPIAAYLGALVALALASAFVAVIGVVIFLPPRPPDVMRADIVAEHFRVGYDHMLTANRPLNESGMIWLIEDEEPHKPPTPQIRHTQVLLARGLELKPDQVLIAAAHVASGDTFVFQVREVHAMERAAERETERAAERVAERAAREAERAEREAERAARQHEREAEHRTAREAQAAAHAEARARHGEQMALEAERAAQAYEDLVARHEAARERTEEVREAQRARVTLERERLREQIDADVRRRVAEAQERVRVEGGRVFVTPPDVDVDVDGFEPLEIETPTPPTAPTTSAPQRPPEAPAPPDPPDVPMFAPAPAGVALISGFLVAAELPDGRWLVMKQGRNWAEIGWIMRAAAIIGGTLLILSLLAVLFARRLTRPIRSFSDAVQAVGVNPQNEPVVEEGPRELRGAARAVNTMQARLRALIADRTKTLAAVAHDMRTPLMRLRLAAENAPSEQRERMAKEIEEVEALVASFIAFARDDPAEEARVRLDLSALLQSITYDQAEAGRDVSFDGEERLVITGQSLGLKRLFANLVENALKYGAVARIRMRRDDGLVIVDVEDDGPGVPADQRESVFEPFVRLNEDGTRGAGLGLPAARSIARAHGGDIAILDAEKGALLRVKLPG